MTPRQELLLLFLGLPSSRFFTDQIRIMKGMFLLSQEGPGVLRGLYNFVAYDYGPFDTSVYHDLDGLALDGLVEVANVPGTNRRVYELTDRGEGESARLRTRLAPDVLKALADVKQRVTSLSFKELLDYVYERYPAFATRSLYRQ